MTAATGAGLAAVASGLKGMTAATGADGVGVVDGEASAHQAVKIVDLGAHEVGGAHIVNKDADAADLDNLISLLGLVERHPILQARAAAASDENAQPQPWVILLLQQGAYLFGGYWSECDQRCGDFSAEVLLLNHEKPTSLSV